MKVKYIGPISGGVEIAATGTIVGGDEPDTVEVPDEVGVALCEQTVNWEPADPASRKTFAAFCEWVAAHDKVFSNETLQWSWRPMPYQQHVWDVALEVDDHGRFAYDAIDLTIMRQSGKKAPATTTITAAAAADTPEG